MGSIFDEHFRHPRNAGELDGADGAGRAGADDCGAVISVSVKFDGDRIGAAAFQATGSSAVIAAGSILTETVAGMTWREAAALPEAAIASALTGADAISPGRTAAIGQAAMFAIEALHSAFEAAIAGGRIPEAPALDRDAVLVAMSGGVDSSVACLLERDAGRLVTGVTMRLWSDPDSDGSASGGPGGSGATGGPGGPGGPDGAPSCCSPQAIRDARAICHKMGLPHLTVDYASRFETEVVDEFVAEYLAGRTPNPCTRCNGAFRFPELVLLADRLGAARVATGHYVRLVYGEGGDARHSAPDQVKRILLRRGFDQAKDQSYMLWAVEPALLSRLEFPLGRFTKEETRARAREGGLSVHARPESQEVCFIPDDDYRGFVRRRGDATAGRGDIVDSDGARLGEHEGYMDFTVGQRRGLGVSSPEPLYVLRTDPENNLVVAGRREELATRMLAITGVNAFISPGELAGKSLMVQARYNSAAVPGKVVEAGTDDWKLELDEPVYGIAPGQSAVIYAGDVLVAGGVISATG